MNCKKCGKELTEAIEQSSDLCKNCLLEEINSADETFEPLFKPRFWIATTLDVVAFFVLIIGIIAAIFTFASISLPGNVAIAFALLIGSAVVTSIMLGISEIVRMNYNRTL